jgi:hypothetical protein
MEIITLVGITLALTLIVMALYGLGYKHGWDRGYESAFRCIAADFKRGKELFWESGLEQWDVPRHWRIEEACD